MNEASVRIDALSYARLPKVNARSGVALLRAILTALPKDAPASVKHAARTARNDAVELQSARRVGRKSAPKETQRRTAREVDNEADAVLAAIHRRLGDHELLAEQEPEAAARAARLKGALYPDGVDFLRGDMLSQWEETEEWFRTLAEGDNEAALRSLVGGGFVEAIRAVHAEYGEAVGTTRARSEAPAKVDLAAPLASLTVSTQDLALQLVALANDGSASDLLRRAARAALRPIDELREGNARRAARRPVAENDADDASDDVIPDVA